MSIDLRKKALNPEESFIVQAPAGSGKTELLTQRFLRLLACVNEPEEIIAITFTRKAANEMRERVLNALENLSRQPITQELVKAVLEKNQQAGWDLLNNPYRLRILTIDSLSASLCAQMPILTEFGIPSKVAEEATIYYQKAIHQLVDRTECHPALENLLLHLDNNFSKLESLFISMLAKRDQWLAHIVPYHQNSEQLKKHLEMGLENIVLDKMIVLRKALPESIFATLVLLADYSAKNLNLTGFSSIPETKLSDFSAWQYLANLLLTKEGNWRKKIDKNIGFPPLKHHPEKDQLENLIQSLADNIDLQEKLADIQSCPPILYQSDQWEIIHTLIHLLPLLAAELKLVFQAEGVIDFIEMTQGALRALGDRDQPTDLALQLDYQIRHLLIDEFQDTSVSQFCLFEQLMQGWMPGDGRTVFLVGDPMQSIYRFRQAEVGLFLRAKLYGIAGISLTAIDLSENFRSRPELIQWTNSTFDAIFPKNSDMTSGAIPYSALQATRENHRFAGVHFYPLINATAIDEAEQITQIIKQCLTENPQSKIAILARSRQPLAVITDTLREHQIAFNATDIESLANRPEIQDILSLTRALMHLGDRIAWLACLRAPWCGLTLADLHAIVQYADEKLIWIALQDFQQIPHFSEEGKKRFQRIQPILQQAFESQGRLPLDRWIQTAWIGIGGPATLSHEAALKNITRFLELLREIGPHFSAESLSQKLTKSFAQTTHQTHASVEIMTIHKAKGLEFDHVILPNLQAKVTADDSPLLRWLETPTTTQHKNLVLAPIHGAHESQEPIYDFLKSIEKNKADYETQRLLYVAVTRARESLHLTGLLKQNPDKTLKKPIKGAFLEILWDVCHSQIIQSAREIDPTKKEAKLATILLQRLASNWQSPLSDQNTYVKPAPNILE